MFWKYISDLGVAGDGLCWFGVDQHRMEMALVLLKIQHSLRALMNLLVLTMPN